MTHAGSNIEHPPYPSIIFLVGFMGAGKTTVGHILASRLGYTFFDLDQIIEQQTSRLVREIFAQEGEAEFRRVERSALQSCTRIQNSVVALGGGAFVSDENRTIAKSIGKTVWLECPLDVCLSRIEGDKSRPLLKGKDEMVALMNSRRSSYEEADLVIHCGDDSPEEVAEAILALLG